MPKSKVAAEEEGKQQKTLTHNFTKHLKLFDV